MVKAKKSLSQNFLVDNNICKKILKFSSINNRTVLEIGPGYGFMTDEIIANKPKELILIEKDFKLIKYLNGKYKNNKKISIYEGDILKFNLENYKNLIVISNLPYNVSTKIILYLFNFNKNILEMIFMIQKEVAIKFNYNLPNMNKYKFLTRITTNFKICFEVSPNVFIPKPKVSSSVVKFKFKRNNFDLQNAIFFSKQIFKNIRKKISNNISTKKYHSSMNKRVNQLSIDELLDIYNLF